MSQTTRWLREGWRLRLSLVGCEEGIAPLPGDVRGRGEETGVTIGGV